MNLTHENLALVVKKIKQKREALHFTQTYMAEKLNISQNGYSKIESGRTNFSIERLYEIAEILKVDIKEFF
ncbi:MAG: helix-turn-helix transcriptional regulator [Parafilimonas sp.]